MYMNQSRTDSQTRTIYHSFFLCSTQTPHAVRTTRSSASAKYRRFLLFSPAIEIRPFAVIYTCASLTSALDCAVEIPVKLAPDNHNISQTAHFSSQFSSPTHLNIPIWLIIWSQFPGVLSSLVNTPCSCLRMSMMRLAIVRISAFHSSKSSGLFKINATLT